MYDTHKDYVMKKSYPSYLGFSYVTVSVIQEKISAHVKDI